MATRLYLRNYKVPNAETIYGNNYMLLGNGAALKSHVVTLTNGGNNIPWTDSAAGVSSIWVSPQVSGGFTLSAQMTFNVWASESNANDETTIAFLVGYHVSGSSTATIITGSPFSLGAELGTTAAQLVWSGTPTPTAIPDGARLILQPLAVATTTMTAGTATLRTNNTSAGTAESFVDFTETIPWKTETITDTIKLSGGDYELLSTWESTKQEDLVTNNLIVQAECYSGSFSNAVTLAGWTTGPDNYIRIYTPTSERHDGRSRDVSGVGFQMANTGVLINIQEDYCRIEGLNLKSETTNSCLAATVLTAGLNDIRIDSCVFQAAGIANTASIVGLTADTDFIGYIRNSIIYGTGIGIQAHGGTGAIEISNNTVQATGLYGIRYAGGATIRNNWAGGASTECFRLEAGSPTGSNNASTDASADDEFPTGAVVNTSATGQFTSLTAGSEDFSLITGSVLVDAGTTITAVPTDIIGNPRS